MNSQMTDLARAGKWGLREAIGFGPRSALAAKPLFAQQRVERQHAHAATGELEQLAPRVCGFEAAAVGVWRHVGLIKRFSVAAAIGKRTEAIGLERSHAKSLRGRRSQQGTSAGLPPERSSA